MYLVFNQQKDPYMFIVMEKLDEVMRSGVKADLNLQKGIT